MRLLGDTQECLFETELVYQDLNGEQVMLPFLEDEQGTCHIL